LLLIVPPSTATTAVYPPLPSSDIGFSGFDGTSMASKRLTDNLAKALKTASCAIA